MMPGPLNGLKVYEIGWGAPGAITGMLLADYGATVIKVERPGPGAHRTSSTRPFWDRGKWSIELDLDQTQDVTTLLALIDDADVLIESLGVGRATQRGFGYDTVHALNPGLIYCSVSAYGQDGPLRDRPGYDSLVAARLGLMAEQIGPRPGPKFLGHPSVDYCTSFLASIGILAALRARFHTGAGQFVDTSLLDGALAVSLMNWWWNEKNLSYLAREGTETGFGHNRLITDLFICADGEYLMNHTGGDGGFKRTMDILGLGDKVRTIEGLEFSVPLDEDEYVTSLTDARNVFSYLEGPLGFFGHTHLQGGFAWVRGHYSYAAQIDPFDSLRNKSKTVFRLDPDGSYLINPGSVGQPRDGDARAGWAIYDSEVRDVSLHRTAYDWEKTCARIISAGLPDILGTRLGRGH